MPLQANDRGWDAIVAQHDLRPVPMAKLASWPFVDGWFATDFDMVQSTIKIRPRRVRRVS